MGEGTEDPNHAEWGIQIEILKWQVRLGFVAGVFVASGNPRGEGLWRLGGAEESRLGEYHPPVVAHSVWKSLQAHQLFKGLCHNQSSQQAGWLDQ